MQFDALFKSEIKNKKLKMDSLRQTDFIKQFYYRET